LKFQLILWWRHGLLVDEVHPMGGYPIWQFLKLENSWKFNFEIWMKVDELHSEVWNVLSIKLVYRFQLKSCHLDVGWKIDTCRQVLIVLWVWLNIVNYFGRQLKMSFWVVKNILQLEVTFSTSKCSWNIVKTLVENLNFLVYVMFFS
jgi:hypothetical protein